MSDHADDRVERRAAQLLPEERRVGSADPAGQAETILRESDDRQENPVPEEQRVSEPPD